MVPIWQQDKQYIFVLFLRLYSWVSFCFTFHISFGCISFISMKNCIPFSQLPSAKPSAIFGSFPYFSLRSQGYAISLFEGLQASYLLAEQLQLSIFCQLMQKNSLCFSWHWNCGIFKASSTSLIAWLNQADRMQSSVGMSILYGPLSTQSWKMVL